MSPFCWPSTFCTVIVKPLPALALGWPMPRIDGTQPWLVVPAVQ